MADRTLLLVIAVSAAALTGCDTYEKPDPTAIEQQLRQNEQQWNRAFAAHDAEAVAAMYSDDAALATPGSALVTGKDAIRRESSAFAADPNLNVEFAADRVAVASSGDFAYTRGRYTLTTTNPETQQPRTSTGNYLTVWKLQTDGSWKAVEDFLTPGPEPVAGTAGD